MYKCISLLFTLAALHIQAGNIDPYSYKMHSQVQWVWGVLSMDTLELSGSEAALDIGSGDGKLTNLLASKLPDGFVLGIDPSPEFVFLSQDSYKAHNISFAIGDAEALSYHKEFDLITAFLSLNWVSDLDETLSGMYEAIKPGGRALIVIPEKPQPELIAEWIKHFNQDKWIPYLHLFSKQYSRSKEEWEKSIADAGWTLEQWQVIKTPTVFHDREEMKQWILTLNTDLEQLPIDLLEELIDIRLNIIKSCYPQAEDGRLYAFPKRVVIHLYRSH